MFNLFTANHCRCWLLCRKNLKKAHGSGFLFALSQSLIFFSYAAIFTFGAWLIINDGLRFDDMFKWVQIHCAQLHLCERSGARVRACVRARVCVRVCKHYMQIYAHLFCIAFSQMGLFSFNAAMNENLFIHINKITVKICQFWKILPLIMLNFVLHKFTVS